MPTQTITTDATQATRLAVSFGKQLNLTDGNGDPRDATAAEIKFATIQFLKKVVFDQEYKVKNDAISIPDFEPT